MDILQIKINSIISEISKINYSQKKNFEGYKIYYYTNYIDIYIDSIDPDKIIDILNTIEAKEFLIYTNKKYFYKLDKNDPKSIEIFKKNHSNLENKEIKIRAIMNNI